MMRKALIFRVAVVAATPAIAQDQSDQGERPGDGFTKVGWLHVAPNGGSGPISGPGLPPGTAISVQNADTLGLSIGRRFADNSAVESIVNVPPRLRSDALMQINVNMAMAYPHSAGFRLWAAHA